MDRINHPYDHYNIKRMLGECLLISILLGKDSRKLVESQASAEQFNICVLKAEPGKLNLKRCETVIIYEPVHEISNNVVCATSTASDQTAHKRSLIRAFTSHFFIL